MDFNDDENIEWLMESSKTVENVVENDVDFELRERETLELCNFLQVLRSAFDSEPALVESKAKGAVKSEEDVQKLIKRLKALGYFYSIRNSDKKPDKQNCKLLVVNKKNPPSSHPYRINSHTHYCCSHKNKQELQDKSSQTTKERRKYSDCKAVMDVRQVEVFTSINLPPARKKRMLVFKNFRRRLAKNPNLSGELKHIVVISLPKMHNHDRDVKGQGLMEEVKAAMHCLLRSGVNSVPEIQQKLYEIVDQDFENDSVKPSRDNSAFYPNPKTIYNHLRRDGLVMKRSYKKNPVKLTDLKCKINNELNEVFAAVNKSTDYEQLLNTLPMVQNIKKLFLMDQPTGKS